jgi:hypothetical protein
MYPLFYRVPTVLRKTLTKESFQLGIKWYLAHLDRVPCRTDLVRNCSDESSSEQIQTTVVDLASYVRHQGTRSK